MVARNALALGIALAGLLCVQPAGALSMIPNPLAFATASPGQLRLVAVEAGLPAGGVALAGSVGPSDTSLVLALRLDAGAGSLAGFSIALLDAALQLEPTAAGWIPGGDADLAGASLAGMANFELAEPLGPGMAADLLWVSYARVADGNRLLIGIPQGPRRDFFSGLLVPEPAPGLLWVAAIAAGRRRRQVRACGGRKGRARRRDSAAAPQRLRGRPGAPTPFQ